MAYIKTDWEDGDVITEAGLDHLETGVYNNSVAIGDLTDLDTTAKTNLVAAINEAAQSGGGGGGMSNAVKDALLQIASKVAYIDADGQDYYDDLYDALYPAAAIVSINAEYTQTGTVYTTTSLDDLRNDLVVTAIYDNGSVVPVITYTLSGSLTVGTSTITATYSGFTDTFTVTVSAAPTVSSIAAVYTQSGTVYDTDSIDSLKADLVVTATYSDSSTATVPSADYTLSGTLTVGTSTITVTYESKTTTFNVTVSDSIPSGYTAYDYVSLIASGSGIGIHTNIQMNTDYTFETEVLYTSTTASSATNLFGTRIGGNGTKEFAVFVTPSSGKLGYWVNNTDTTITSNPFSANTRLTLKYLPVGKGTTYPSQNVISVNGIECETGNTSTGVAFSSWFGFFLYAISESALSGNYLSNIGQTIGHTVIKNATGTIIHDLVAVSNGTNIGYFDKKTASLYLANDPSKFAVGNWT